MSVKVPQCYFSNFVLGLGFSRQFQIFPGLFQKVKMSIFWLREVLSNFQVFFFFRLAETPAFFSTKVPNEFSVIWLLSSQHRNAAMLGSKNGPLRSLMPNYMWACVKWKRTLPRHKVNGENRSFCSILFHFHIRQWKSHVFTHQVADTANSSATWKSSYELACLATSTILKGEEGTLQLPKGMKTDILKRITLF